MWTHREKQNWDATKHSYTVFNNRQLKYLIEKENYNRRKKGLVKGSN